MSTVILLWSLAVFLASVFAAILTGVTLTRKHNIIITSAVWAAAAAAGYVLTVLSYSINLTNDFFGILGLSAIICAVSQFLYQGSWSSKLFISLTSCLIANVSTFMFCGTTDTLLAGRLGLIKESPYETPNLIFFIGVKLIVYTIIFILYWRALRLKFREMIKVLNGRMDAYIAAPLVSVVGFYVINLVTNSLSIFPGSVWFLPLYATICVIFLIEFWLLISSVLQNARAMKNAAELNVATNIQKSMLPGIFPAFPDRKEFDIYAAMRPAKEVGGDFYDFFLVDDDHLALVIADVSGKGVPAALFMMIAKTLLKNAAQSGLSPKEVLGRVNYRLLENNSAEMFVTVWLGILEISTGKMICSNAGHENPMIKRKGEPFEMFKDPHGFVLAGMETSKYKEYELQLNPGDILFVYTDGVTEATTKDLRLFGTDGILKSLNSRDGIPVKERIIAAYQDIDAFVGSAPQFDDITMLALEIKENRSHQRKMTYPPAVESIEPATQFVDSVLTAAGAPQKVLTQVDVAIDELLSNIVYYSTADKMTLGCEVSGSSATIRFADNGVRYDPTQKKDPDITLPLEKRQAGGLGIYIVKKTMDSVKYTFEGGWNVVTIIKSW